MKRFLLVLFSFILCLTLVGCKNNQEVVLGEVTINYLSDNTIAKTEKYAKNMEMYAPTKLGYDFLGWQLNGKTIDFDSLKATIDALKESTLIDTELDLVAKWEKHQYVVTFDSDGGDEIENVLVEYRQSLTELPTPVKGDYTFLGWYTDIDLTDEFDLSTLIEEDLVLYAKWIKSEMTVRYVTNGGNAIDSIVVPYNTEIAEVPTPTKEGHYFRGWYLDNLFSREFVNGPVIRDLTLYAKWEPYKLTVKFMEETAYDDIIVDWGTGIDELPQPEREERIFRGWYIDSGRKTQYIPGTPITQDLQLYPLFTKKTYTVHFETNGGVEIEDLEVPYDSELGIVVATKLGHRFAGWYSDRELTTKFNNTDIVTGNMTLYAAWDVLYYTLILNYNAPTTKDEHDDVVAATINDVMGEDQQQYSVTVEYNTLLNLKTPSCPGYSFDGWYTSISYTTEWDPTSRITNNITVYAKWTRITYVITFDSNGGTSVDPITVAQGELAQRPRNPSKTGYRFTGWYTDINLTTAFNWDKKIDGNMTLYASWQEALAQ